MARIGRGNLGTRKDRIKPRKMPLQRRSQDTVECILRATTHILADEGSWALSTNRIAREAGVSIGSLYQFFPNKESILSAVVIKRLQADQEFFRRELAGIESLPGCQKLEKLIAVGMVRHQMEWKLMKVIFEQLGGTGLQQIVHQVHIEFQHFLGVLLDSVSSIKSSDAIKKVKTFVYAQTILGIWHSQIHKPWNELDVKLVAQSTARMIARDYEI